MRLLHTGSFLLTLGSLAACGGSGANSPMIDDPDFAFTTSNGILADIMVPDEDSTEILPNEAARVVNGFRARNEQGVALATAPMGNASFEGEFATGFDTDDLMAGDILLAVDFEGGGISGFFNNISVYNTDGTQRETNAGSLDVTGAVTDVALDGSLIGNLDVAGTGYAVDASFSGTVVGTSFGDDTLGIGTITGTITENEQEPEALDGLLFLDSIQP